MPGLAGYWLKAPAASASDPLDNFVDAPATEAIDESDRGPALEAFGPVSGSGYRAKLFLTQSSPYSLPWAEFLRTEFNELNQRPVMPSPAALLVMEVSVDGVLQYFGFAFGFAGRHLLRSGVWQRGYGLRTALNLIYPAGTVQADLGRLIAVDAKTRSSQVIRSRRQASHATTLESFDLDRLRDVLGSASGRPADREQWGTRITGADAIYLSLDIGFSGLPELCRRLLSAHEQVDYRQRFPWLDDLQPVADRDRVATLEARVLKDLQSEDLGHLDLSPPEIVDWTRVDGFRFHFERNVIRPEMRLSDYLRGLKSKPALLLTVEGLKARSIYAVDAEGNTVHKWSVWRCLVGEFSTDHGTVILDEGEFIDVADNYLAQLNDFVSSLPIGHTHFPAADPAAREATYLSHVVETVSDCILLDQKTVSVAGQTTPVEICDILTADRELVHVKRHLGSSDLSHLFAQGAVSASLLHDDVTFRSLTASRVREASGGNSRFDFISSASLRPSDFAIVFGVIADWRSRSTAVALPFFSKVNLRRTASELQRRGYEVAFVQIDTT